MNMKQISWFNAKTLQFALGTTGRIGSAGKVATSVVAAMLIIAASSTGCSKKNKEVAVNSAGQNNSTQGLTVPATQALSAMPTVQVSEPAKPKKVAKKRPSTVTYNDANYGISFQYPRKYSLK